MSGNYNTNAKSKTKASEKDYWRSPPPLINDALALLNVNQFDTDVCCSTRERGIAQACHHITEEDDAFKTKWFEPFYSLPSFCNPPFSLKWKFFERAIQQVQEYNKTVLFVMPYESVGGVWRKNVDPVNCIVYKPDGRYHYLLPDGTKPKSGCNFPTALIHIVPFYTGGAIYINYERGFITR